MRNSTYLVLEARMKSVRTICSIFALGVFCLMVALYTPWVFSASEDTAEKPEWSVCMPFVKAANKQRQITAEALEREFAKFTPPEKENVSKERAAYLELSSNTLAYGVVVGQWQWNSLKKDIDKIYTGKITAKKIMIDINNNGSLEHVVEFRSLPPFTRAWNIVLDEGGGFHRDFFKRSGQPETVIGELRVFNQRTYVFDIRNPVLKPRSGEFSSLPFVIYRPSKSAMMVNSGIAKYGHGALCEFEVIHE